MKLSDLRAANIARQELWPGRDEIGLAFRGLELAGETGELCNLVKKLCRIRGGIAGTPASEAEEERLLVAIEEELGDVLIALDLAALDLGLPAFGDLAEIRRCNLRFHGAGQSLPELGLALFHAVARFTEEIEAGRRIWRDIRAAGAVVGALDLLARDLGITLGPVTAAKFNRTSEKLGIPVFLGLPAPLNEKDASHVA
ncbi:hypothetical protein R5H32_16005 [Defluviimonas sp. D31]|uniref:hypothetical protein n=1 Tax=Defluviimonas sp. D31 TaxID=3083253 RepID=UPI00296F0E09|nr:hypothetical protein [Defluviimonas sp. D31]MDW4550866.1 hypothetical protein [Defluviimonas sp. D31]